MLKQQNIYKEPAFSLDTEFDGEVLQIKQDIDGELQCISMFIDEFDKVVEFVNELKRDGF